MNTNQINDLKTRISNIEQLDINAIVSDIFKNKDINNILIGQFTVPKYVSTLKRLLKQFKIEFEENGDFLPFQYNYQNEYGNGNLQNDFQNLANQLSAKTQPNLNSSVVFINRLVYYQIANGFWDKSIRKYHKASEIKITELNDQLNLISKQLTKYSDNYKLMVDELNKKKEGVQNLINLKTVELQQITNNLQTSNSNTNQISQLLTSSTSTNEKIISLLNQQTQT